MAANPAVITVLQNLGAGFFRQHLFHGNASYLNAVDLLAPGVKFTGAAGQLSDSEATVRAEIAAWRGDARSANLMAIHGPNEPNGNTTGFASGAAANTVRQQWWIWDEVVNGGAWTNRPGNARPLIVGPALKRAGFSAATQYDDDIAALAAATFTTGGTTYHLDNLCDAGDSHHYDGVNGPGLRVDGRDGYGNRPAGLPLGSDGKCSLLVSETWRARQMFGSRANPKPMWWTEWGWTGADGTPSLQQRALFAVESFIRAYLLGVPTAIYETVDEYPYYSGGREDYFGIYNLTGGANGSAGPKPVYTSLQTLFGYTGSRSFTGIGWVEPQTFGVTPDVGVAVFSKAAGGWDVYLLHEADTSVDFVTAPGHAVTGRTVTSTDSAGNSHYTVNMNATMVVLAVT